MIATATSYLAVFLAGFLISRLAFLIRIFRRDRAEAQARHILRGVQNFWESSRPRNPYILFGATMPPYVPRHSAEPYTEKELRKLLEAAAEPSPLPVRRPGASLNLNPPPEIPVARVFT